MTTPVRCPGFAWLTVDRVRVVGRDGPLTVHALLGDEKLAGDAEFIAFAAAHQSMLQAYHQRRWGEAAELNDTNEERASGFCLTTLVMLYRDRLHAFAAKPPPPDWDGVFEATSK